VSAAWRIASRGRFRPALERVRRARRGGDLLGGLGHAGGLLIAVLVHLGAAESGQVAVDEHVVGIDDVQDAGAGPQEVRTPDERPPGRLGVIEADDQRDGRRRPGLWGAGDRSLRDNWYDGLGQYGGGTSERRDQDQAGHAGQRPGGQGPEVRGRVMAAEVDDVANGAGRYP